MAKFSDSFSKVRLLGEGGMGEVWLVTHRDTRVLYAAKFLHLRRDKDRVRFLREINILKSIVHANVIRIEAVFPDERPPVYVMEYCPDGDLDTFSRESGGLDPTDVLIQLTRAAVHLHSLGRIHRDIKPANVLVAPDRTIRLSDFGLAVDADPERPAVTSSTWCSPGFSAPEQLDNSATVTEAGDIFSLGAVYYYLLKSSCIDLWRPLDPQLDGVGDFQRYILRRTLAINSNERFTSASDLLRHLDTFKEHKLETHFSLSPGDRLAKLEKRMEEGRPSAIDYMLDELNAILVYEEDAQVKTYVNECISEIEAEIEDWREELRRQEG